MKYDPDMFLTGLLRVTHIDWPLMFHSLKIKFIIVPLGVQWLVTGAVPSSREQILYPKSYVTSLRAKSPTKANTDHHNCV